MKNDVLNIIISITNTEYYTEFMILLVMVCVTTNISIYNTVTHRGRGADSCS